MATPVEAPKLGNTVEEVLIARWAKRKGDAVAAGELIAEIETDKATFEVTAPVAGTLLETFFEEGALVPVFTNLFVIGEAGENVDAFRPGLTPEKAGESACPTPALGRTGIEPVQSGPGSSSPFSPRARRFADEHDFHPASLRGSGPGGRILEDDVRKAYYSAPPSRPLRPSRTFARKSPAGCVSR